jgi:hypothetical protein
VDLVFSGVFGGIERQLWGILLRWWIDVHDSGLPNWCSPSCTLKVWDMLLKSLSQFSERAKLPLIVNGPLFAGIRSLR